MKDFLESQIFSCSTKGRASRNHLEKDASEGPDVGAGGDEVSSARFSDAVASIISNSRIASVIIPQYLWTDILGCADE